MTDTPPTEAAQTSATPREKQRAELIMERRERVAAMYERYFSQRQIVAALAAGSDGKPPLLNPDTDKPFDLAQINRDIKWLEAECVKELRTAPEIHAGRILRRLHVAQRMAYVNSDPRAMMQGLKQEAQLLGVEAPTKERAIDWQDELIALLVAGTITPDEVIAELGEDVGRPLVARARLGGMA